MMNKQKTSKAWSWKVATFLPLLALLLIFCGRKGGNVTPEVSGSKVSETTSTKIEGAWTLVSLKYTYPNGNVFEKHEFKYPTLKIFTKTYYSYGNIYNDNGILEAAGGGKYSVIGDTLVEKISYCLNADFMGKESRFRIRIQDNKLFESGTLPIGLKIEEEYIRIE